MRTELAEAMAARDGMARVADLALVGISRHVVDRAVRAGELIRLRKDLVVEAATWREVMPSGRHVLRARAVWASFPSGMAARLALSHHSSLAVQGLPMLGVDDLVHLVRTDGGRGRSSGLVQLHAGVPACFVRQVGSLPVVGADLACLQVADTFGAAAGLVPADAAMRAGQASHAGLVQALEGGRFGRGRRMAAAVVALADGRSESPGESRARWVMHVAGLPPPGLQRWIFDRTGTAVGRVDFLFGPQRTIVEFDGLVKYEGASGREELAREKIREDRLRDLGYEVVRLTWADLSDPARVRQLVLAAFARQAARSAR